MGKLGGKNIKKPIEKPEVIWEDPPADWYREKEK
jgi:hypothetical protein